MTYRCPYQSKDILIAKNRNNLDHSTGACTESGRVVYRYGYYGSFSKKENRTGFYHSDEKQGNIAFSKRHYGRRKERKRVQNVEATFQSEKEKDMNGNDKFGEKFIPHPPDIPKSPQNRENKSTADNRSLPTIRGGKLPPIGGKDQDRRIEDIQDSHGMDVEQKKSSKRSVEAGPEIPKPNSGSGPCESESSSEEESDESDSSADSQVANEEKKNSTRKGDTTDGVHVKNPFKKRKNKQKQRVLARQKEFDFEKYSGENDSTVRVGKTDDGDLLKSYENYMREVTNEDNETTSSESDDYSVSSLSDEDTDGNDGKERSTDLGLKPKQNNALLHSKGNVDEALYSLPLKKTDRHKQPAGSDSLKNTLGLSSRFLLTKETLDNTYMKMDNLKLLRSLSDPNLRRNSLGQIKPLKTHTYLTPVDQDFIAHLYAANNALARRPSNGSIDSQGQGLRFRPLPPIPASKATKTTEDDSLYETINVCPRCQAREKKGLSLSRDPSTDSTTRSKMSFKTVANTLISVMPRLTTQEARSRKMDKALADIKQYLPDHKLRIFLGTWNMKGTKVLPEKLDDLLLPPESVYVQDIYAVGTQEGTPFRREWELRLQETLGPSHVLLHSCNFGVLQLSIFVRREIIWYCTGVEQESVATRMGHQIKTKGALAVAFTVFGTSLLFINSHFTSDEGKLRDRLNDYRNICKSLSMVMGLSKGTQEDDVTAKFDRVFWIGDFNFRVQKPRSDVDKVLVKHTDKKNTIKELLKYDQLLDMLYKGKIFHGFTEHPIHFMPTYKFDVNTDIYDSSTKKRVPSWTDRVLMRTARPDQIEVISYNSCETIKNSDHRPVYCVVEAAIEPIRTKYTVPGGRFDRDLYVEANLRRNAPTGSQGASNVCTIL